MRKAEISSQLERVRATLPQSTTLIVVTKNFPPSDLEILYQLGERNFGENRVQELVEKRQLLNSRFSDEVIWHYQGQIQSNKIKLLNQYADVVHSLSCAKRAESLDNGQDLGSVIFSNLEKWDPQLQVFLQVNLDNDPSETGRGGVPAQAAVRCATALFHHFGENFKGVMGIAPHSDATLDQQIHSGFSQLRTVSEEIKSSIPTASFISAGMSDDYQIALDYGATHIRLGSSILGKRA